MVNWTDPIIHWNQLGSTATKRLIDTWGFTPEQIAAYDASGGKVKPKASKAPRAAEVKTTPAKKVQKVVSPGRQKHTGVDGEIKFVEHRNLHVGFFGGRVVVTKRTKEACRDFLVANYPVLIAE